MKTEYDKEVDAAYIYLADKIEKGAVQKTIKLNDNISLDFDKDNKLLGIEILRASQTLPKIKDFTKLAA
ncbi:MAG: DUF2283 domain-containing protein [archaeon]